MTWITYLGLTRKMYNERISEKRSRENENKSAFETLLKRNKHFKMIFKAEIGNIKLA